MSQPDEEFVLCRFSRADERSVAGDLSRHPNFPAQIPQGKAPFWVPCFVRNAGRHRP